MKMTKKITGVIMVIAVLMLSMVSAFAANTETEREILSHDFNAYQIFSATGVDGKYLTDVEWGNMFGGTRQRNLFLASLKSSDEFKVGGVNIFADCEEADDVARVLADYDDYSDIAKAFASHAYDYANVTFGGPYKNGDTISFNQTSLGRRWYLTYLFVKQLLKEGDCLFIDEPAAFLHPQAQGQYAPLFL